MAIFELSWISKKLKRFRAFQGYFRKQFIIEVIWAKYEEIRNFATGNNAGNTLEMQQLPVILDLCLRKTLSGKSLDYRDVCLKSISEKD